MTPLKTSQLRGWTPCKHDVTWPAAASLLSEPSSTTSRLPNSTKASHALSPKPKPVLNDLVIPVPPTAPTTTVGGRVPKFSSRPHETTPQHSTLTLLHRPTNAQNSHLRFVVMCLPPELNDASQQ